MQAATIQGLGWSTYFGGGNADYIYRTKSDVNNDLFVAGKTISSDLPQAPGATPVQSSVVLGYDGFLSCFDADGVLKWTTFFGGGGSDLINDIDFTGGDVFCVGATSSFDIPIKNKTGAFNDAAFAGGGYDGFIFQVDKNTGGQNKWTTYFGGDGDDIFRGCTFDGSGNFYAVGGGNSTNLSVNGPTGAYVMNYNSAQQTGFTNFDVKDGIITKFHAGTSVLDWFTFSSIDTLGSNAGFSASDDFYDIEINGNDIYVCGESGGTDLPTKVNSKVLNGQQDGIVLRFNASTLVPAHGKFTNNLRNRCVRVFNNHVFCCGLSRNGVTNVNSGDFFYDNTCASGDQDACFSVHSTDLNTTIHNTFLGGTGIDEAFEMQFATNSVFYIAGPTAASNFPITNIIANTYQASQQGLVDNFVAAFKEGLPYIVWSTCLGTSDEETELGKEACSISLDQQFLHLGGATRSYNTFPVYLPLSQTYYQPQLAGGAFADFDGTITRFDLEAINIYTGIEDFPDTQFSFGVYPNPTAEFLLIDNSDLNNQNLSYAIYNATGQRLAIGKLEAKEAQTVNVSSLSDGVYIINVSNGTRTFSNKFIKVSK